MFVEDNSENHIQISQLTFWSSRIPRSKEFLTIVSGPILNILSNYKINCHKPVGPYTLDVLNLSIINQLLIAQLTCAI